jgi:ERCC4-related helicase
LLFATPEVIRNDVHEHRYTLTGVCLVVFDEARRCVKEYAYSEVAEAYKREALNPLILGLTASPNALRDRVLEICGKLAIENDEARSQADEDLEGYVKGEENSEGWFCFNFEDSTFCALDFGGQIL